MIPMFIGALFEEPQRVCVCARAGSDAAELSLSS